MLGGAGAVLVALWRGGLRWQRGGRLAWAVALAGFACTEFALQIPAVQTAFWLAVRARLDVQGPNYLSEVCYVRLEEAAGRTSEVPAVILAGTSQMLCGVDEHELGRMLAPQTVIRREVSGMVPQNMLAMWSWIPFRRGDRCVQLRSEMDFTDQAEWRTSWYRPFLTWETLPWLMANAGGSVCGTHWREVADCVLAASLEGWRMRDGWRELAMNPWRRLPGTGNQEMANPAGRRPTVPLEWSEWEWRAFMAEAERLKRAGGELWVFEGNVHPLLHGERRTVMRHEFERRMAQGEAEGLWRFVGEAELGAEIESRDWRDMTHVNAEGRRKLTQAMGWILRGGRRGRGDLPSPRR